MTTRSMKFIFGKPRKEKKINHGGKNHPRKTCFEFLILANASKTPLWCICGWTW